jgi:hypothetical protein
MVSALPRFARSAGVFLAWALAFGLTYAQSPLYTSNQNQYFLHGAAQAGVGYLADDWLANTVDSVPLFGILTQLTYRTLPETAFYVYYILLFGVYLFCLFDIASHAVDLTGPAARAAFFGTFFLLHSAALRLVLVRLFGPEWDYLFDGGVAGQRLLGPVLQPSCFGVFLVLSISLFLRRRPYLAVAAAALAASVHPTYLLSAAAITLAYLLMTYPETHSLRTPILLGLTGLVLVAPIALYVVFALGPTSPDLSAQAQEILVEFRIPHHAIVREWLDVTVLIKLLLIGAGMLLARRSRLLPILITSSVVALSLTAVQILTDSNRLALLFPWRLSTWLVPIGTGLLCAWVGNRLGTLVESRFPAGKRGLPVVITASLVALAAIGASRFWLEMKQIRTSAAQPMLAFVANSVQAGDLYLIPPRLQEFRLATGAPTLADLKSIPYLDVEVLEWYARVRMAGWFYRDQPEYVDCSLLDRFREEYGVTHVVLDQNLLGLACPELGEALCRDASYAIYRLVIP